MRCRFVAEYEERLGKSLMTVTSRTSAGEPMDCDDVSAAGRECRRRLDARPRAFRVEAWDGSRYVTKAQRGEEIPWPALCCVSERLHMALTDEKAAATCVRLGIDVPTWAAETRRRIAEAQDEHGPGCFCAAVCMPTPRDEDETKGDAT